MMLHRVIGLALLLWPVAGQALELALPANAQLTREITQEAETYRVPVAPYAEGRIPTLEVEGSFVQQVWKLEAQATTTLQMLMPIRTQLKEAGFDILLDCAGPECGGFDFRFATRVMPAPDMFVDLFDYRFLTARSESQDPDMPSNYLTVLVSRSAATGYFQLIRVDPSGRDSLSVETSFSGGSTSLIPDVVQPVAQALLSQGHVILSDLNFQSGSSELGAGPFVSLQDLADFLNADATLRVALVGHTDTVGGLEPNIALSKRRAESVLERLVEGYGVAPDQIDAEGMGYLSPIAPNLNQEGREANRRVEAVLLNSE